MSNPRMTSALRLLFCCPGKPEPLIFLITVIPQIKKEGLINSLLEKGRGVSLGHATPHTIFL